MRMPRKPPRMSDLLGALSAPSSERITQLLGSRIEGVHKDAYLHWEDLRVRKPPADFSREEWWLAIKLQRTTVRRELPFLDKSGRPFSYSDSGDLYRRLRAVDRDCSGQIEVPFGEGVRQDSGQRYLMSSLIEESIASSQLEGAATTRQVAKEMLRTGRSPLDTSEQMIVNNYHAMEFLRQHIEEDLSVEMLQELHRILTYKTQQAPKAGRFRLPSDKVDVASWDGTVVHTPPDAVELDERIEKLLAFANEKDDGRNIHPFVRAVVLHFMVGYDHPFVDGNGRTARGLFYWSMARSAYWLAQYLSISSIVRKAPAQYVRAYVYSEIDESDVSYFLYYNLKVMLRAISKLHVYLARKTSEMEEFWRVIRGSDMVLDLNYRQTALLGRLLRYPDQTYTIASHQRSHKVTYQTARVDLIELADLGVLEMRKRGRRLIYTRNPGFESNLRELRESMKGTPYLMSGASTLRKILKPRAQPIARMHGMVPA